MSKYFKLLSCSTILFFILFLAGAPCIFAQNDMPDWLYGIWKGTTHFTYKNVADRQPGFMELRVNDGGATVKFESRGCQSQWTLESFESESAIFRERIIKEKGMPKPNSNSNACVDGGTVMVRWYEERGAPPTLGFTIFPAGSTSVENHLGGGSLWAINNPTDEEFKQYFAIKIGNYYVNRQSVRRCAEFGLKVADVVFPANRLESTKQYDITNKYPMVVAVLEGSSSYYEGIVPGDILVSLGDRWSMNDSESFVQAARENMSRYNASLLSYYYDVPGEQYVQSGGVNLAYADTGGGGAKWLTQVPIHRKSARGMLPGVKEANDKAKAEYADYSQKIVAEMKSRPCEDVRIASKVANMNWLAIQSGDYGENQQRTELLTETAKAICESKGEAGLTKTEMLVLGVALKKIDPCRYEPAQDLSVFFNDLENVRYFSRKGYENAFNINLSNIFRGSGMTLSDTQKICFYKMLRTAFEVPN